MKNKKENRGGARQGSGAKPKYGVKTVTKAFRVPINSVDELVLIVKSFLKSKEE